MKEEFGWTLLNGGKSRNEGPSRFWGNVLHGRMPGHGDSCFNAPENSSRFPTNSSFWLPESLPSLICLGFCLFCLVWYSGVNPFLVCLAGSTDGAPSIYATPHQPQLVCSPKAGVIHSPCSWLGSAAIRSGVVLFIWLLISRWQSVG